MNAATEKTKKCLKVSCDDGLKTWGLSAMARSFVLLVKVWLSCVRSHASFCLEGVLCEFVSTSNEKT